MKIALLDAGIASFPSVGARDVAEARRQRLEDRIETFDYWLIAADHHAITTLDAPDTAGGADINIVDAAFSESLAAADVVLPERVAAIDDDVAGFHQLGKRLDRGFGDMARRQHHPGGTRFFQSAYEFLQRAAACRAFRGNRGYGFGVVVVDHGRMPVAHQTADNIAAHPSQADHAELHMRFLCFSRGTVALPLPTGEVTTSRLLSPCVIMGSSSTLAGSRDRAP